MTDKTAILELIAAVGPACKEHGIRRLRVGEIEMEFGGGAPVIDPKSVKQFQEFMEQGMPTDGDVLGWSAPGGLDSPPPAPRKRRS